MRASGVERKEISSMWPLVGLKPSLAFSAQKRDMLGGNKWTTRPAIRLPCPAWLPDAHTGICTLMRVSTGNTHREGACNLTNHGHTLPHVTHPR